MNGSTKLSLEGVKKAYRTLYASMKKNHTRDKRNETTLFTRSGTVTPGRGYTKVFKGDYRTCLQIGHKSANCWEKLANRNKIHTIGREKLS
jgi:hypothetical protein